MISAQNIVVSILIFIVSSHVAFAEIVMTAPPRENEAAGKNDYEPIARELSELLGEAVIYQHPLNWTTYAKDMRSGKYDIVFDGPHFAAWRIANAGHVPLARLSGYLQFYIIARKDDKSMKKMNDLLSKSFCGMASPNLGTMAAFNLYRNPVSQPSIQIVKGSMKNVMVAFLKGECRAAVVWDKLYKGLSAEDKAKVRIIARSRKLPNQSITASNRLEPEVRTKISNFFTSTRGAKASSRLLDRYSNNHKDYFVTTSSAEYVGLNELLEGVVFGW